LLWNKSTDNNKTLHYYNILQNDVKVGWTTTTNYQLSNVRPLPYTYTVEAVDTAANVSPPSPGAFLHLKDTTPPTKPENLQLIDVRMRSATLTWSASYDASGPVEYVVTHEGKDSPPQKELSYHVANLDIETAYTFKLRALDVSGKYSVPASIILDVRPGKPRNPSSHSVFIAEKWPMEHIEWEADVDTSIDYEHIIKMDDSNHTFSQGRPAPGTLKNESLQMSEDNKVRTAEIRSRLRGTKETSEPLLFTFRTDVTPPKPPTNLKFSRTENSATLTWTASVDEDITHYVILRDEEVPFFIPASECSYTAHNLPSTSSYLFRIWAIDGVKRPSEWIFIYVSKDSTPPSKPGPPEFSDITFTSSDVKWAPSTDNIGVTGYEVSVNGSATMVTETGHTLTGLKHSTSYTVEVRATDFPGNLSQPATAAFNTLVLNPPTKPGIPQPSNLTDASVTLTWAPSTDNGGEIKYLIYLNGYLVARTEQPQFNLKYLQSHTDYSVEVRAINDAGRSEPAGTTFKTRLRPPTHLRFSHSNGLCRLAWDPVFRQHPAHEVSINGQVFTTAPGRWGYNFKLADVSPGPVPHHFKFSVHAKLDGDTSEVALLEKTVADDVPPSAPGAPVVSAITDSGATLTWEPSSDNIGVTGYRVLLNGLLFSTPDTHFTFTKLTSGAYHRVYVGARDKDGNVSAYSRSAVFKTTGQAPQPAPASPSAQLIPRTSTSVRLEWSKGEGGATQGVRVLVNDEHRFDSLITGIDLNLELDVEHTISVSAFDVYGQLSEPTVLTYVPKDVTPPSLPGNLHIAEATTDSVTLAWESSTDDIGVHEYVIYNNHEYFDSTPLTHYTAVNLLPGTYSFEVCALDLSGNASEPAAITVRTQGPPPSAPSNFRFTQPGLVPTLEWDAPIDMEDVLRYDIVLTGPQGTELPYQSVNTFLKPILLPRTRYEVSITAVSALDRSLPLISELTTK
jgi:chitodextrinase